MRNPRHGKGVKPGSRCKSMFVSVSPQPSRRHPRRLRADVATLAPRGTAQCGPAGTFTRIARGAVLVASAIRPASRVQLYAPRGLYTQLYHGSA